MCTHTHTHAWRETERMCKLLYVCLEADSKRGSEGSNIGNNNSDASTAAATAAAATAGQKRACWRWRWLSQPPSRLNTQHKKPSQAKPGQANVGRGGGRLNAASPSMPKKKKQQQQHKTRPKWANNCAIAAPTTTTKLVTRAKILFHFLCFFSRLGIALSRLSDLCSDFFRDLFTAFTTWQIRMGIRSIRAPPNSPLLDLCRDLWVCLHNLHSKSICFKSAKPLNDLTYL